MAYRDFTLRDLSVKFGVKNRKVHLFGKIDSVQPSNNLKESLIDAEELPSRNEKAKSETIVFPILNELRKANHKFFTIYSGENLSADPENGLKGECDFMLAKDIQSVDINLPIIQLVEAKKNDIELGIPQCAAQMVGAKIFNEQSDAGIDVIYGCVTTGDEWLFMKLDKNELLVDKQTYYLNQLPEILGVFQHIIEYYKTTLK